MLAVCHRLCAGSLRLENASRLLRRAEFDAALAAAPDPSALLARRHGGEAPLHLAAQKGDLVVAALLVLNGDSGELLNAVDAEGRRPHDLLSGDAAEALAELLRPR